MFSITVLLVLNLDHGLSGAFLARIVSAAVVPACLLVFLFRRPCRRASYLSEVKTMASTTIPMAVFIISSTVLVQFDRLFVRNLLTSDSGGFGAVITLGVMPLLLIGPIVFIVFPLSAAEHAGGRTLSRFYRQSVLLALTVTGAIVLGIVLFGEPLFEMWNPNFKAYAGFAALYALAMGIEGTVHALASIEMARHRYACLWVMAITAFAMCTVLYILRFSIDLAGLIVVLGLSRVALLVGTLCVISRLSSAETATRPAD
ncbi:MAG: hypothetical protein OSB41_03420, partial [Kiritimatiellae bacterium]|nr:hypothetical protein [Kiritimatiellia bacterium]